MPGKVYMDSPDEAADGFLDKLFGDYDQARADGAQVKERRAAREQAQLPQTAGNELLQVFSEGASPTPQPYSSVDAEEDDPIITLARMLRRQNE